MTIKQWYGLIGQKDSIFDVPDPALFKEATSNILCNILHLENTHKRKELQDFCDLIQTDVVKKDQEKIKKDIASNVKIVKEQLEGDEYKMLQFMKMLNRFIMVDHCKEEDYCVFEDVKSLLFGKE